MSNDLTSRAVNILQDDLNVNEDYILSKIKDAWSVQYAAAVRAQMDFDPDFQENDVPSFGFVCEQINIKDEENFLIFLSKISE